MDHPQTLFVEAMKDPGFYPNRPDEVTYRETHISHVFIAGELVYKVKKPVRYSFLDYSTLDKRQHFLREEMRLNKRLASSVYLAVVPITLSINVIVLSCEVRCMRFARGETIIM